MADVQTVNLTMQMDPAIGETIHKAIANYETVAALLAENKQLLTKVLNLSLETLEISTCGQETVIGDGVREPTGTGDLGPGE